MRFLRITLEEHKHGTVFRAERAITNTQVKSFKDFARVLECEFADLEKTLNNEIKKHEQSNVSRPAVCSAPNPEAAPGNNEAEGVGR